MSVFIDRKYLGFVSHKLEQFKQKKTDLYNFRCPYCGDSKKNKLKTRGFIYRKSNDYFYVCHNCNKSTTFGRFLQEIDGTVYKQYALERYANGETGKHNYQKPTFDELRGNAFSRLQSTGPESAGDPEGHRYDELSRLQPSGETEVDAEEYSRLGTTWDSSGLESIASLPEGHYARDYIKKRKIPEKYWNEIFFAPAFLDFLNDKFPDHGKEEDKVPNDDRIVLFYTNENGEVTNVAGRALSDTKIRYITIKVKIGRAHV